MEINKLNSLVELYFNKCSEIDDNKPFLKWLKSGKPTYSWRDIKERIFWAKHNLDREHIVELTRNEELSLDLSGRHR